MTIYTLDDPICGDVAVAGGKAANLSRLRQRLRQAVPAGWVIPVAETQRILERTGGQEQLVIPSYLEAELEAAFDSAPNTYAVRSSACEEDSIDRSFAGQFESFLGVQTVDAAVEAVCHCIRSAESSRVQAYKKLSQSHSAAHLAILIQGMIPAERSGVTFTNHPVTGARVVVVNATYGLGDLLVGGEVTPDEYQVDRRGAIIQSTAGSKRQMSLVTPGGIIKEAVPIVLRNALSLLDNQVTAVANLSLRCEAILGYPVDVEWAIADETVYILQARPITSSRTRGVG